MTAFGSVSVPLYAAATVLLWFVARPFADTLWKRASVGALASAAVAMLANQAISHVWDRPRPFVTHAATTHLLSAPSPDPSFPSDHAAAAFAIAFAVLFCSRRAGAGFLVVATLIALTRIALGLHYPSDVIAGAIVGWASATLVVHAGGTWLVRAVALLSRLSDPLLAPIWRRLLARRFVRA